MKKHFILICLGLTITCHVSAQNVYESPNLKEQIKKLDLAHARATRHPRYVLNFLSNVSAVLQTVPTNEGIQ